jgi:zinc transport system substrate-binding protein
MIVMASLRASLTVRFALAFTLLACATTASAQARAAAPLKIGVTLHPYYSWTKNVVGTLPGYEVRPILPGEIDAGDYQPRPDDIKKLVDLDAIVINGLGHDDFIMPMIKSSGNTKLTIIRVNETTPQIHAVHGTGVNSHTFISFTNAIQQAYAIQKALTALRPADAAALQRNASEYARRLRLIKSKGAQQLAEARITRVVTVHDGYGYLLQEFGLEVAGVVQPAHGLTPSAGELRDMVKLLQKEKIRVVFSEETFPEPMLKVLRDEAGVKVYIITHIASGEYTADKFEREMQRNVDTMVRALVTEA